MRTGLLTAALLLCCCFSVRSQTFFHELSQDTIVRLPGFPGPTYLLGGKKLNLPVMSWFMSEVQPARDNILGATVSHQLASLGYTFGAVFTTSGLLIRNSNRGASGDLLVVAAIGLGTGLLFQAVENGFKRRAVRQYNQYISRHFFGSH